MNIWHLFRTRKYRLRKLNDLVQLMPRKSDSIQRTELLLANPTLLRNTITSHLEFQSIWSLCYSISSTPWYREARGFLLSLPRAETSKNQWLKTAVTLWGELAASSKIKDSDPPWARLNELFYRNSRNSFPYETSTTVEGLKSPLLPSILCKVRFTWLKDLGETFYVWPHGGSIILALKGFQKHQFKIRVLPINSGKHPFVSSSLT